MHPLDGAWKMSPLLHPNHHRHRRSPSTGPGPSHTLSRRETSSRSSSFSCHSSFHCWSSTSSAGSRTRHSQCSVSQCRRRWRWKSSDWRWHRRRPRGGAAAGCRCCWWHSNRAGKSPRILRRIRFSVDGTRGSGRLWRTSRRTAHSPRGTRCTGLVGGQSKSLETSTHHDTG